MSADIKKLNARHRLVSYMLAGGRSRAEVAEATGFSAAYLTSLIASPLFKAQLTRVRNKISEAAVESVVEDLQARTVGAGGNALDTVLDLMSDAKSEQVRLHAASSILDRAIPKQTKHQEEQIIRLSLDGKALDRMSSVLTEFKQAKKTLEPAEYTISDPTIPLPDIDELIEASDAGVSE